MDDGVDVATIGSMIRPGLVFAALVFASLSVGCSEDCTTEEPVFAGEATDEAWLEMLDARVDAAEGGDAPTFTAPEADASVPASSSPTFAWDSPLKLSSSSFSSPSLSSSSSSSVQRLPTFSGTWRRRSPTWFDRVAAVVLPSAHAHLPPITSDVYLLEVDVPGRTCPVAALTTELTFTFDDDGWDAIATGGGERTARLLSAFLTENNVTEGPFVAAPVTFTVTE
jgi:hypothetical protein